MLPAAAGGPPSKGLAGGPRRFCVRPLTSAHPLRYTDTHMCAWLQHACHVLRRRVGCHRRSVCVPDGVRAGGRLHDLPGPRAAAFLSRKRNVLVLPEPGRAASGQPSLGVCGLTAVCTSRTDAFSHSLSLNPFETCWPHHPTPLWGRDTQCLRGFRLTGHLIL